MLPKLILILCRFTVCLGEPLTQSQDSLIDILLKFYRVVKGVLRPKGGSVFLRQFPALNEPLKGTERFVVDPDFPGACSGFACEFLSRHEEVKQGCQRLVDGSQKCLFLKPLKAAAADVFADDCSVFLFDETVVIFLMVS
jgi:hypothetical protein